MTRKITPSPRRRCARCGLLPAAPWSLRLVLGESARTHQVARHGHTSSRSVALGYVPSRRRRGEDRNDWACLRLARHLDGVAREAMELWKATLRARAALLILNDGRTLAQAARAPRRPARSGRSPGTDRRRMRFDSSTSRPGRFQRAGLLATGTRRGCRPRRIGRGMGVVASIGATAPFVGLFGTVWGIMNSFIGISNAHTTNLAVVAPGIAEALLATALGLFAAIPAVVIYNVFARSDRRLSGAARRWLGTCHAAGQPRSARATSVADSSRAAAE